MSERSAPVERIVADYGGGPGPLFVCLTAMHGNEPAGLMAARTVCATLSASTVS